MDDEADVAAVLARFLRAVSFGPGGSPNYGALRNMFSEGARLIKNSAAVPEISTVPSSSHLVTSKQRPDG